MAGVAFYDIFGNTSIIGMIHLSGDDSEEIKRRALEELALYERCGVDGAIIEDYIGQKEDVYEVLRASKKGFKIKRGVNVLGDPYMAFRWASEFGAKFIQFDSVQSCDIDVNKYKQLREQYQDIAVLGGVRFKYTTQDTGKPLEEDLEDAKGLCEAVVTTGEGTGKETPTKKLERFKELLGEFPLIDGAGVNPGNAYDQLVICNGAIIGTYFKPDGNIRLPVDEGRVIEVMEIARKVRDFKHRESILDRY